MIKVMNKKEDKMNNKLIKIKIISKTTIRSQRTKSQTKNNSLNNNNNNK